MQCQHISEISSSVKTPDLQTRYFQRAEGTLAFTDYGGSGQPILMLPGMGALRSQYRFLAPILYQAGYRSVTVDLRGHGDSSVPWQTYDVPAVGNDIVSLIQYIGAGPAHVIATSYSPAPSIWAAVERPEHIRSLVLISAFASDTKPNLIMRAATWFMLNNPWRVQTWRMFNRTWFPTHKPADLEEYLDQLTANLSQPGRFEAVKALPSAPREPLIERLPRVKAPALVVMGTKDMDFPDPIAEGRYLSERIGGKLVLIEGAGHYPQTEMPEKTASAVMEFLGQV